MTWWTTEAGLRQAVAAWGTPTNAARELGGVSERQVRDLWKRIESGQPVHRASSASSSDIANDAHASAKITDTTAVLISAANPRGTNHLTPEEMLIDQGLDPEEWDFRVSVTSYDALAGDGQITTLHRIRVDAVRRKSALITKIFDSEWRPPKPRRARKSTKPRIIAAFPDPHFPHVEPALYEASLAWLDEMQPSEAILLGDLSDASPFGRHTKNRRTDTTVAEHITGTYEGLAGWRGAAPNTRIRALRGNHDGWAMQRVLEMFPAFADLRRPGEDMDLLSMRSVLNLDSLHIETIETSGQYHDEVFEVLPDLVAMHGVAAGVHGAIKEFDAWEATSIIQGHAHRLEVTAITKRLPSGGESQRYAINGGTMARRDLGYNHKHDVAQGWIVFVVHPCGRWTPEIVTFDPVTNTTAHREWLYKP